MLNEKLQTQEEGNSPNSSSLDSSDKQQNNIGTTFQLQSNGHNLSTNQLKLLEQKVNPKVSKFVESTLKKTHKKIQFLIEELGECCDCLTEYQNTLLMESSSIVTKIADVLRMFNPDKDSLRMYPILESIIEKKRINSVFSNYGEFQMQRNYPKLVSFLDKYIGSPSLQENSKASNNGYTSVKTKYTMTTNSEPIISSLPKIKQF